MNHSSKFAILLIGFAFHAAGAEADYVNKYCGGVIEYVLPDNTRVDCLTETHAIEYDWDYKWAEAIGQSLHYSRLTGKKAGIVLIVSPGSNGKHVSKVAAIIDYYNLPIDYWLIDK